MTGFRPARIVTRHAKWFALAATMAVFALSAAPASAIMVKLPNGHYANYEAMSGAKTPPQQRRFDLAFQNLDYSGGPIMRSNENTVVVWDPNQTAYPYPAAQPGQTDYVTGVTTFLSDLAAASGQHTNSDSVSTQYNDSSGGAAAYASSYGGILVDTDPYPAINGCPANSGDICLSDAQIQAELDSFLSANHQPADFAHEYFLLTPPAVASCFDAAGTACSSNADQNTMFCAYHSRTAQDGYIYANIPALSGYSACDPYVQAGASSYENGPADGVLSAVSHEHNESITDPEPNNAWTDWGSSVGGEIGDKCNDDALSGAYTVFTDPTTGAPYNETIGNHHYTIQGEWSNQNHRCEEAFTPASTSVTASFASSYSGSGTTMNFNAAGSSATGGVADYVWQFNDKNGHGQNATIEQPGPSYSHTFPAPGVYLVGLTVLANDGTSHGIAAIVQAGALPAPSFAAPPALENVAVPLTASVTDANPGATISSYSWNFGDGGTAVGALTSHAFHAGLYTVTLTVTDSYGLSNSFARQILVLDDAPTVGFGAPSGRARVAISFHGSAFDSDGTIVRYRWSFGDGGAASTINARHTYHRAGRYTVALTVSDSGGQSATVRRTVVIKPARCVVPALTGRTLADARTALAASDCSLGRFTVPHRPTRSPGRHRRWALVVTRQKPRPSKLGPPASTVEVTVTWRAIR